MKTKTFLAICFLLGCFILKAQSPCSNFNDLSNPYGNWAPGPGVNNNVSFTTGTSNTLDGSQYVVLKDESGGSWYSNLTDFKNLGQRFSGQCLYFDFYLESDGGYGSPIHPTIYIMAGTQMIKFVANVTVTPGSGWVRVRAPLKNCTGSTLPSNSDGTWTMAAGMTCADFNNIMNNSTAVMVSPDYTSSPSERVWYDNICVKSCDGCTADFKFDTSFNTTTTTAIANLTLLNPNLVSTPGNPGSTYTVDWGDGSPTSNYLTSTLSHTYVNQGTYTICVTEIRDNRGICRKCYTFCYTNNSKPGQVATKNAQLENMDKNNTLINDYVLVPNPAKNYVDVITNLSKNEMVSVKISDLSGKVMLEKKQSIDSGRQSIQLNTEKLISGTYLVEIKSNSQTSSQKLLISK